MLEEIFDSEGELCHFVVRTAQLHGRVDLTNPDWLLQVGVIQGEQGASFRPHVHIPKRVESTTLPTMEAWVVIRGSVTVHYFDESGYPIGFRKIGEGDMTVTIKGGHGFKSDEEFLAIEFKSGPYLGQQMDKVFLTD